MFMRDLPDRYLDGIDLRTLPRDEWVRLLMARAHRARAQAMWDLFGRVLARLRRSAAAVVDLARKRRGA